MDARRAPDDGSAGNLLDGLATDLRERLGEDVDLVAARLERRLGAAASALRRLYPDVARPLLERTLAIAVDAAAARPAELRRLDLRREACPDWYQRPEMVGYVAYADRLAGDLAGVGTRLDYLAELGIR